MSHPDLIPLLITDELTAIRSFYLDDLGCAAVLDQDGYVQVRFGDASDTRELAFTSPDGLGGAMAGASPYAGGLIVSIAVDDADKYHAHLAERGIDAPEPTDKPWGWRSFAVPDPTGVVLDFFHAITDTATQDAKS